MELKDKTIAFLGDSITQGVGASCQENIFVQVFKKNCGLKEAVNYGISGTRFAKQTVPHDPNIDGLYFSSRVDEMREDVDAVVVFGGTNDYGHGSAPLGCFGDTTADTFYGACYELMEKLINKYPTLPIVFMTPLHRTCEDDSRLKEIPKNLALCDYVYAIREVAEYFSIPVLDLYATSGMQPNIDIINKLFFTDGLHPNDAGHARIAQKLECFLKNI